MYRLRDEELAGRFAEQLTAAERAQLVALEAVGGAAGGDDPHARIAAREAVRGPSARTWN